MKNRNIYTNLAKSSTGKREELKLSQSCPLLFTTQSSRAITLLLLPGNAGILLGSIWEQCYVEYIGKENQSKCH